MNYPLARTSHVSSPYRHIVPISAGAVVWGVMMATCALFALVYDYERFHGPDRYVLLFLYFIGAAFAYATAYPIILRLGRLKARWFRFAACALVLAVLTSGATAFVIAMQYRSYYAQWHAPALSVQWFFEQFFTALGSTYQYAVIGVRLYWPLGPLFLIATSWWLSRRTS